MEVLRGASSDGQLTVDELDVRVSAAYAARTRRELEQLTADVTPATVTHQSAGTVKEGPGGDRQVISIMGGTSVRRGRKLSKAERREVREAERPRRLER